MYPTDSERSRGLRIVAICVVLAFIGFGIGRLLHSTVGMIIFFLALLGLIAGIVLNAFPLLARSRVAPQPKEPGEQPKNSFDDLKPKNRDT